MELKSNFCGLLKIYENIYFIDVETTGFDKKIDTIIEISIIQISLDNNMPAIKSKYSFFVKPYKPISDKIIALTGITNEILNTAGLSPYKAARIIVDILGEESKICIAHNANFDINFIVQLLRNENLMWNWANIDFIDTLTIFRDRHPYPHKLSDAIIAYGLENIANNSHRAEDDAFATMMIFDSMCKEKSDVGKYINLFGFNPKYPITSDYMLNKILYKEQAYNRKTHLYGEE